MVTKAQIDKVVETLWADRKYYDHPEAGHAFFEETDYGSLGSKFWKPLARNFKEAITDALDNLTWGGGYLQAVRPRKQDFRRELLAQCEAYNVKVEGEKAKPRVVTQRFKATYRL